MLKKILVVEDNEDNRRILVYRLRKIGRFDIREAANGQQAIEAVKVERPDLIFMDLKMPVMDGWEATKRIREMDGGEAIRIIALTAQAMAGDEQKALAIGCDDYLAKPVVDPDLVRQKLERLIGVAACPALARADRRARTAAGLPRAGGNLLASQRGRPVPDCRDEGGGKRRR